MWDDLLPHVKHHFPVLFNQLMEHWAATENDREWLVRNAAEPPKSLAEIIVAVNKRCVGKTVQQLFEDIQNMSATARSMGIINAG